MTEDEPGIRSQGFYKTLLKKFELFGNGKPLSMFISKLGNLNITLNSIHPNLTHIVSLQN